MRGTCVFQHAVVTAWAFLKFITCKWAPAVEIICCRADDPVQQDAKLTPAADAAPFGPGCVSIDCLDIAIDVCGVIEEGDFGDSCVEESCGAN